MTTSTPASGRDPVETRGDAWEAWFDGLAQALRRRTDPERPQQRPAFVDVPAPIPPRPVLLWWPDYSAGYYGLEWWSR